ncbi:hypothetical protein I5Q34_03020 [Streptomyces sp. AV19]|uniref:DUF6314 family protein n=1 Tax=Streptomyces sp. AV19 TaxID=2793068 RepID=UPI0018FE4994|nr:DUF6314 family protein [Streptomyces sp. AV19]MBH1933269.1 hypothetical protein [Streptomyces sp. AV19]MDG4536160.1 DUF6314 family protein [Streptomyces sp. AV19]
MRSAAPHPVPDAVAYLTGRWAVERELLDLRTDSAGTFRGTARFERAGAGGRVLHVEDGELRWGGTAVDAGRTLGLAPGPDGTAAVTFADGRPFHDLDLRTGRWTVRHPCAADRYDGTFTVVSPDEWHLRWRTTGPAKDHLLSSVYRRLPPVDR